MFTVLLSVPVLQSSLGRNHRTNLKLNNSFCIIDVWRSQYLQASFAGDATPLAKTLSAQDV